MSTSLNFHWPGFSQDRHPWGKTPVLGVERKKKTGTTSLEDGRQGVLEGSYKDGWNPMGIEWDGINLLTGLYSPLPSGRKKNVSRRLVFLRCPAISRGLSLQHHLPGQLPAQPR